jgi:hypothetical protein
MNMFKNRIFFFFSLLTPPRQKKVPFSILFLHHLVRCLNLRRMILLDNFIRA